MTRHRLLLPAAAIALLVGLAGCTDADSTDEAPAPTDSAAAESGEAPDEAGDAGQEGSGEDSGVRGTTDAVLAEQTFDAGAEGEGEDNPGGTVTAMVRSLEVSGETMTLRWAMRWDHDEAADDAAVSMYDLGMSALPQLTDTVNLKQYLPLCTKGSWQGGMLDSQQCGYNALVSPRNAIYAELPNHAVVEGWAVFAAPQDDGASFDLPISEKTPSFAGLTPLEVD
ncbi:hypothetical protein J4G33_05900 [Actinotalea sp. BY-33]|uniref:DUF4352 domain-containing protein n=1 Tax=Actinotalea soli TaxID=2819234 RepID=A0A939LN28_9CELL|nr:hypothetical protein [Actinotalea soli]MBO1751332.1 hypothetical protein [Actinotalea soli]